MTKPPAKPSPKTNRRKILFLQEHMDVAGVDQPELARLSGYSLTHINQVLKGKRRWNEDLVWDLSGALGRQPEDLFINPEDPAPALISLAGVPPHLRRHVTKVAESFTEANAPFEAEKLSPPTAKPKKVARKKR